MSRFSKSDIALLVLATVYIVMPIDLIPELITGPLGLTDDMAAVAMIAAVVMRSRRTPRHYSCVSIRAPLASLLRNACPRVTLCVTRGSPSSFYSRHPPRQSRVALRVTPA